MAPYTRFGSSHLSFIRYEDLRREVCYNAFLSDFPTAEIKMGIASL